MIPASRATAERVALGYAVAAQQRDDLGRDEHPAGRRGLAGGDVLARHVDHPGRAGLVDVGEAVAPSGLLVESSRSTGTCSPGVDRG